MSTTIVSWNAFALTGTTASPWGATQTDGSLSATPGLVRDTGLTAGSLTKGYSSSGFPTSSTAPNGGASTTDLNFTLTVGTGFTMALSELDLNYRASATGPTQLEVDYSVNGGAYGVAGSGITLATTAALASISPLNLSSISSLQTLSAGNTVKFRLLPYAANASGGTFAVFNSNSTSADLAVKGSAATSAVPTVTSVSPTSGNIEGGNTVLINGTGFYQASAVNFGGNGASTYTVVSNTQISAVAPGGSAGTVAVSVANAGSVTSTTNGSYTYNTVPMVTGVSPSAGPLAGNNSITITGVGLDDANPVVNFNSTAGVVTADSSTSITVTVPSSALVGVVDVKVTTAGGTSLIVTADKYTYVAQPTVTSLTGNTTGIDSGGTSVVIHGTGLASVTGVNFGANAATGLSYSPSTQTLTVISPAVSGPGTVDVTVVSPGGTSVLNPPADQFTYTLTTIRSIYNATSGAIVTLDDNPVITEILEQPSTPTPNGGPLSKSYTATAFLLTDATGSCEIFGLPTGSTFTPAVGDVVSATGAFTIFDGIAELSTITAISSTSTAAVPPPLTTTVSAASHSNISSTVISPTLAGYVVTVNNVSISGIAGLFGTSNLTGTISDGTNTETLFYWESSQQVEFSDLANTTVPIGKVNMTGFLSLSGTVEFSPFTITPVVTSVSPTAGSTAGGTSVTINGYGFKAGSPNAPIVDFGATPGTSVNVISDTQLTVNAPANSSTGTVDVTVTTNNGTSLTSTADQFGYTNAPAVGSLSVAGGTTLGGTSLNINGSNFTLATSVSIDGTTLSSSAWSIVSDSQISVNSTPAHAAGTGDVIVSVGPVPSAINVGDKYTYAGTPSVTGLSPTTGPDEGGTTVVISGTGFFAGETVDFGTTAATVVSTNASAGTITVLTPVGTASTTPVDVTVITSVGTSPVAAADKFTYTVTTVADIEGLTPGATVVLDSNPVISAILSAPGTINTKSYNGWSFLIDDGTGSLEAFSTTALPGGYVPVVGNTVKVSGTYSPFNGIPEFGTITAISTTGTAAVPAPIMETVGAISGPSIPLGTGYGGHLVSIANATIGNFNAGTGYALTTFTSPPTMNDGTGQLTFFYWPTSYSLPNEQFEGTSVSAGPISVTGIVDIFGTTPEFVPMYYTARPAWLTQTSAAVWAPQTGPSGTLYVNSPSTIIADPINTQTIPGTPDVPAILSTDVGGTLNIAYPTSGNSIHLGGITLSGNATTGGPTITVNQSTGTPIAVINSGPLSIDAFSTLNLTNNFLDTSASNLPAVNALLVQGFNAGTWTGNGGITSSAAAGSPLTSLGVIVNDNGAGVPLYGVNGTIQTSFDGTTPADGDVLVSYTYYGDANVDGKVDGTDYGVIDASYVSENFVNGAPTSMVSGWSSGDFNYDGVVDGSDYTLIDNAFNTQGNPFPSAMIASPAALIAGGTNSSKKSGAAVSQLPVTSTSTIVTSNFSNKKVKASLIDQVLQDLVTSK